MSKKLNQFVLWTSQKSLNLIKVFVPVKTRLKLKNNMPVFAVKKVWNKYEDDKNWPLPENANLPGIQRYEYSLFSQNGEDGIFRYIFSEIGIKANFFVEIGFEITECNSLRLMIKENMGGILIDGVERTVNNFNEAARQSGYKNVKAINKFIDLENIEQTLMVEGGVPKEIDLLSIDVDGNDYWFWEKIDFVSPRLVIIEFNASLGPELSLAVPYDPLFDRHEKHESGFYCSASITAFTKLANKKGYSLIGCDSAGVNLFFLRNDCLTDNIQTLTPSEVFRPHSSRLKRGFSQEEQYNLIRDMPYITIQ